SAFADAYLPPGFGQKDEDASYRAPVGAVSVSFNAVQVTVTPPDEGMADPTIEMSPPNDYVDLEKHVRTLPGDGQSVSFSSEPIDGRRTRIRVAGAIGADSEPVSERLRIDYPSRFAGSVLERALEMVGVTVEGDVRRGEVPSGAQALHTDTSHPLSYAILAMNKWSNNFMAEQLLRTLGRGEEGAPATWERARGRVRQFLVSAGLATDEFELHNGSGLYEGNAISARNVVRLLVSMSDHRWAPEYLASLSIAGRDGTLKERMEDTAAADRLRGKTGTLNDVSALSGWVRTQSGRRVAFSILLDETPEKGWRYRPVLDAIAVELAEFDG
ncbi:MAG: D-alanyl-D-alanine carboxypeptidase/D-alanyl-D-alanine-endopeptidase, partial [Bradymonadaceae bacterium]